MNPVRPRDAASLIAWRRSRRGVEVLMGRRAARHNFPNYYVFPGGRLDRADFLTTPASGLRADVQAALHLHCDPNRARALAVAAARETLEEAGLALGAASALRLEHLDYILRAITPSSSPYRFHARFFAVEADHLQGRLDSNGELLDLAFRPLEDCLKLPLVDVTQYLVRRFIQEGKLAFRADAQLFSFRTGRIVVR